MIDSTATIENHIVYNSFGEIIGQSDPSEAFRFGFTGREYDADVELYQYRARWFDPATGRFISEDPLSFNAGDPNLYRYVGNNPLTLIDPSGLGYTGISSTFTLDSNSIDLNPSGQGSYLGSLGTSVSIGSSNSSGSVTNNAASPVTNTSVGSSNTGSLNTGSSLGLSNTPAVSNPFGTFQADNRSFIQRQVDNVSDFYTRSVAKGAAATSKVLENVENLFYGGVEIIGNGLSAFGGAPAEGPTNVYEGSIGADRNRRAHQQNVVDVTSVGTAVLFEPADWTLTVRDFIEAPLEVASDPWTYAGLLPLATRQGRLLDDVGNYNTRVPQTGTRISGHNPQISPRQQLHTNGAPGKSQFIHGLDVEGVVRTAWEVGVPDSTVLESSWAGGLHSRNQ